MGSRRARDAEYSIIAACLFKLAFPVGYIVVGVNEYSHYLSKKREKFVGQVEIRRLYCSNCKAFMHRDNIYNVARDYLTHQGRSQYLQPVDT
ncbi:hypothetical protein BX616_003956 [Lobosporangium transversale]|nr:hypothetical protein BX616_003956 [Lobosporangium transversale]